MTAPRIAVLGLGNVLLGDDAVGPYVLELLRTGWEFPVAVELTDVGTPGLGLLQYIHRVERLIVVDSVKASGLPGDVRCYRGAEVTAAPPSPRVSPHDPALHEVLSIAAFDGAGPRDVLLIGVIPASLELGAPLTAAVRAGAAVAARCVVEELGRHVIPPVPRVAPLEPNLWWLPPPRAA